MLCFNVNLKIRFNLEFGNTQRALKNLWKPMVVILKSKQWTWQGVRAPHYVIETKKALGDQLEVVDVSEVKIELEEFSGSIFTSLTSTTSTWSSKASFSSSSMSSFWTMCVGRLWSYLLNRTGWASLKSENICHLD